MVRLKDQNKEEAIYQAALHIVLKDGFSGIKMGEVAKAAQVATGTLYLYFSSKEELINKLYLKLKRNSAKEYLHGYDGNAPFMTCLETIWNNYLETLLQRPEESAFLEQYYRSPYLKAEVKAESDRLLQPIFDLLERGKKEKLLIDADTPLLAATLNGSLQELSRWAQRGDLTLNKKLREQAFQMAWNAIKR